LADYYLAKKDFDKALETLKKVNQYQLSKEEYTVYSEIGICQIYDGRF
jgi:hypothetical protein